MTPQATLAVIDYEVPGLYAEAMRAAGRRSTPMADLSRAVAGVRGEEPDREPAGQPRWCAGILEAIVPVLDHALETLAGPFDHAARKPSKAASPASGPVADPRAVVEPDEHE